MSPGDAVGGEVLSRGSAVFDLIRLPLGELRMVHC